MVSESEFNILNTTVQVSGPDSWNEMERGKLLLYHLHYFADLQAHDASRRKLWHENLIDRWIGDNAVMSGVGWEPYPLSIRIVNWVKWALSGNTLSDAALRSLWLQARVLEQSIEYHLLGNHVLANAKALVFAGSFFDGDAANRWLDTGNNLLTAQLQEQILSDGGHFELSPMYHSIVLEDVLDLINLSRAYGLPLQDGSDEVVSKMLRWLRVMTHPDGQLSYFNDATRGVAPSLRDLQEYGARLGFDIEPDTDDSPVFLPDSGYVRFATKNATVLIDVGEIGPDYQPGHGHCDCLSFELSLGATRVFVNRGVSTYSTGGQRTKERSTRAHNTVSIDEQEQSEIWAAFRVGRRARPMDVTVGDDHVVAAHTGYSNLGLLHRRRFEICGTSIRITDSMEDSTSANRKCMAHFHFHPDLELALDDRILKFSGGQLQFTNADTVEMDRYQYCLGFSNRRRGIVVNTSFQGELQSEITLVDAGR